LVVRHVSRVEGGAPLTRRHYARRYEVPRGRDDDAMMKRKALPWAPNCVPDMRRQWCNALDTLVARQSTALQDEPAEATAGGARRLQRLQAKLAESLAQMSAEAEAIPALSCTGCPATWWTWL
jgi:hypothetical protein